MANSHKKTAQQISREVQKSASGAAGGYLVGRKHTQGGIKVVNKSDPNRPIEVQGGEAVITAPALSDKTLHEFEGRKMTKRQILSAINVDAGGVSFAEGGRIKKKMKVRYCNKQYKYGGKMMSGKDIISDCGCQHSKMEAGGEINQSPTELAEKYKMVQRLEPIVVADINLSKSDAKTIYKRLSPVINNIDNNEIKFVSSVFGKFSVDRHSKFIFKCMPLLPEIVKTAIPIYITPNHSPDKNRNIDSFHNYLSKIKIGEQNYAARITAYELKHGNKKTKDPHHLHDLFISDISIIKGELPEDTLSLFRGLRSFTDTNLINWLERAKEASLKYEKGGKPDSQLLNDLSNVQLAVGYQSYQGHPQELMKYVQEQATGLDHSRQHVHTEFVALNSVSKMIGSKDLVFRCVAAMPQVDKEKVIAAWKGKALDPELRRVLRKKSMAAGGTMDDRKTIAVPDLSNEVGNSRYYQHYKRGGVFAKGGEMTTDQLLSSLQKLRKFVPSFQVEALVEIYRGEEREYAAEIIQRLLHTFETMPATYDTEDQETNDKIIYLHYFYGGMDWYIVEKDKGQSKAEEKKAGLTFGAQYQAFGYANLDDSPQGGEWGYISIVELLQTNKVEIDFNWTPITFGQLRGESSDTKDVSTGPSEDQRWLKILKKYPDKSVVASLTKYKQKVYDENEADNNHTENLVLLAKATENGELIEVAELILSQQEKLGHFPPDYRELRDRLSDIIKVEREGSQATISEIAAANPERIIIAKVASSAPATQQQASTTAGQQGAINEQIRALVKKKGPHRDKYSAEEIALLKLYEGAGAEKATTTDVRILDQFFTPMDIVAKMWGMVIKHGFDFKKTSVLEPAVGSGRFLQYIPLPSKDVIVSVDAYDVDETCVNICKVLYPFFAIHHASFESLFFRGRQHIGLSGVTKFYDLVIGNPPYREYVSEYAPLGEKKATGASTFEMYFISRGIDVLKPGGLLCYIIPNTFLSNDNKYNEFKEKLAKKCDLIDAYRLPNGVFGNTDVGTDIILLRKHK